MRAVLERATPPSYHPERQPLSCSASDGNERRRRPSVWHFVTIHRPGRRSRGLRLQSPGCGGTPSGCGTAYLRAVAVSVTGEASSCRCRRLRRGRHVSSWRCRSLRQSRSALSGSLCGSSGSVCALSGSLCGLRRSLSVLRRSVSLSRESVAALSWTQIALSESRPASNEMQRASSGRCTRSRVNCTA
jgi:hypothetical protein